MIAQKIAGRDETAGEAAAAPPMCILEDADDFRYNGRQHERNDNANGHQRPAPIG